MKINKIIALAIAAGAIASSMTAMAEDTIKVYVDGQQLSFDVNPIIDNDRTLVPLRGIFEALGAEVEWNQDTRTASATKGDDRVSITIDSKELYKNGTPVQLDVPAKIVDDRTLVPVRAISESFDANVEWEAETRSVMITTAAPEVTSAPTEAPSATDSAKIQFSEADVAELNSQKELIRYDYEQYLFPQYIFENSDTIYEKLATPESFAEVAFDMWEQTAAAYAITVAMESETEYKIDTEIKDTDELIDYFSDALKAAEVDTENYFEDVATVELENGTRVGVVIFKSADSLVQCKYLGVAVSKDGQPRYFTAENDIMQTDIWFFCEVTAEGRGTLTYFEKKDAATDIEQFVKLATDVYESSATK